MNLNDILGFVSFRKLISVDDDFFIQYGGRPECKRENGRKERLHLVDVGIEHCNDYVKRERNDGQESNLLLPWGREMRLYRRATQPT